MDIQEYISSGIVESFVLGLASPEEVEEVVRLRQEYPELDAAIFAFEDQFESQGQMQAIAPPMGVKEALFAKLNDSFKESEAPLVSIAANKEDTTTPPVVGIKANQGWRRFLSAAAAILFLINAAATVYLYNKYDNLNIAYADLQKEKTEASLRVNTLYANIYKMQDTNMKVIKMAGVEGKENNLATVFWDKETKEVFLFRNNLPKEAAGKQYQLWAIVDGKPVDAGMLSEDCEGLCKLKTIPSAQAFAITLEKAGGSATPTMEEMYVLGGV